MTGSQDVFFPNIIADNEALIAELGSEINFLDNEFRNIHHDILVHDQVEDIETKDIKLLYQAPNLLPILAANYLSIEEYLGPYNFEVCIHPTPSSSSWYFSSSLNKIFLDVKQNIPIDFKIDNRPDKALYIRSTLQYSSQNYLKEPICRCIQHNFRGEPTNKDLPEHVWNHVVRCGNELSQYVGDTTINQKLSVIFPLGMPQAGSESVRELFQFVCLSTCVGIKRRELDLIFTLEDEEAAIFGRKSMKVKVCACPKRDMEKEETKMMKGSASATIPKTKKRKIGQSSSAGKPSTQTANEDFTLYNLSEVIFLRELYSFRDGIFNFNMQIAVANHDLFKKRKTFY
ncbi:hypothetical protein ABEB36_015588 [Hypothenemus hampei]|uniref:p53 DNA-binding domain-containing protein n=1 Tax=Hypothenemus hampei TaxID=57062 RepID=A0ABD1DZN7_HYPHA